MLKHVGEIANTSKRCAVVFLQLPEDPAYSLVVETESLPERFHQPLMAVIESTEGQSSNSLADILARRLMPDTGQSMLQTLHQNGFLEKVSVDNVNLLPRPNTKHKLRDVLEAMGKAVPQPAAKPAVPFEDLNFYQNQAKNESADQKLSVARGYLQQADLMIQDAKRLQEQAYGLAPELRPTSVVETKTVEDVSIEVASKPTKAAKPAKKSQVQAG